jgi:hypothetical protein
MANKLRSVNTKFWDDPFIEELTPTEKLLFLYLITNPLTNLLGVYEITIKRISYDTGISQEMVRKGLERYANGKKVFYEENYIILLNFLKNQNLNSNMKIAVKREFNNLPNSLKIKYTLNDSEWFGMVRNDSGMIREVEVEAEVEAEVEDECEKIDFDLFWNLYDKKVGEKTKLQKKWDKLTKLEKQAALNYIPKYKESQPDKQFRKNPETFLNNKSWLDELIKTDTKMSINEAEKFYKNELELSGNNQLYRTYIRSLWGANDAKLILSNVLSLQEQMTYEQFCNIIELCKKMNESLIKKTMSFENSNAWKGKKSLYISLNDWITKR